MSGEIGFGIRFGNVVRGRLDASGRFVPFARWTQTLASDLWHALFPGPTVRVTRVDRDAGTITLEGDPR